MSSQEIVAGIHSKERQGFGNQKWAPVKVGIFFNKEILEPMEHRLSV